MKKVWMSSLFLLIPFASALADEFDPAQGWQEIVPNGVYRRENADGTIERASFGAAGAAYERKLLAEKIQELQWTKRTTVRDHAEEDSRIAELTRMVDAIDGVSPPPVVNVLSSQTGEICAGYIYKFDSDLSVTSTTATLTGRSILYNTFDDLGPPLAQPTGGIFSLHLTINRAVGAPQDKVASQSLALVGSDPDGKPYLPYTISTSSSTPQVRPYPFCVSAEAQVSLSLTGGTCVVGDAYPDYRSWTKTYPTCVP